jgi:cobalamin biosynthesis protein CobT
MSKTVYDMLIGHEISHALHTPCEGWKLAINAMSGTTDSSNDVWQTASLYLNVVEDARIERLIKNKFPGFKRDFVAGYGELAAKDFFGIKKIDMNKLELADKLNLYYKLGTIGSVGIRFTAEEQTFITRIDASQTFEDAAQIAQDLFTHCKNKKAEDKKQNEQGNPLKDCNGGKSKDKDETQQEQSSTVPQGAEKKDEDKGDKSDKSESKESDSTEGGDESSAGEGDEQGEKSEESADQEKQDKPSKDGTRSDSNGASDQAPTPITQQKLEESLKKSVKKHRGYGETINAPAKLIHCDLAKVVFDYKQCMEFMKKDCPSFFTDTAVREGYDAEIGRASCRERVSQCV